MRVMNFFHEAYKPCLGIDLKHTPMFEWCVIRLDLRMEPNKTCA